MTTSWFTDAWPAGSAARPTQPARSIVPMLWGTGSQATVPCRPGSTGSWRELRSVDAPAAARLVEQPAGTVQAPPTAAGRLCFDESEVARACAAAASAARADAMLEAARDAECDRSRLLQEVLEAVRGLDERRRSDAAGARREFVTVARSVAAALTFRQDADRLAELEATVAAMVRAAPSEAGLVLELAPSNLEAIKDCLDGLPVQVLAADLGPLDARLSWRDGWIEHLRASLEAGIDEALACAAMGGGEPDLEP